MSELNEKAYLIIDNIALYCRNISRDFLELTQKYQDSQSKLDLTENLLEEAQKEIKNFEIKLRDAEAENLKNVELIKQQVSQSKLDLTENLLEEAQKEIKNFETKLRDAEAENLRNVELIKQQKQSLDSYEFSSIAAMAESVIDGKQEGQKTIQPDVKIVELEDEVKIWEEKYRTTHRILQTEMLKMDTMQTELEIAQKERDIALKRQSMSPEQKQILIKLEHESYKINEAIERIDYISNALKKIFALQETYQEKV